MEINIVGVSALICFAGTHIFERAFLFRVWATQPDWAESEGFHEPSWVTNSPRRIWKFSNAMLRADKHLRTNPTDCFLLSVCWLFNIGSLILFVVMLGLIASSYRSRNM
jgi:hypothetical protein